MTASREFLPERKGKPVRLRPQPFLHPGGIMTVKVFCDICERELKSTENSVKVLSRVDPIRPGISHDLIDVCLHCIFRVHGLETNLSLNEIRKRAR